MQGIIINDQHTGLELEPGLGLRQVSLSGYVALLFLHHDYICLRYVKMSDLPSDPFQGVN